MGDLVVANNICVDSTAHRDLKTLPLSYLVSAADS